MNEWQKLVKIIESDKEKRKTIAQTLGYKNISSGVSKIINQIKNKTIAEDKLKIIAPSLGLDTAELIYDYRETIKLYEREQNLLKQIAELKDKISRRDNFKPCIFIETSLVKPYPVKYVSFSVDKIKYITGLPTNILDLSKTEQIDNVKDIILNHCNKNAGKCKAFGDITGYIYYHSFKRGIKFNNSGEVVAESITEETSP